MRRSEGRWQRRDDLKRKLRKIALLLEKEYGVPERRKGIDPLDVLIETILSQNTNDLNRDRAFGRLKTRFPRWEDLLRARREAIVTAIRPGGLANQKAMRIQRILRWIQERGGRLSLSFLEKMETEEVKNVIGGLKGIGPKTVHCLLLFGLGREAFPIDTHILRIGKRMGFLPQNMDAEKAHAWMAPLLPKGKSLSLHLNLIRFGREVCRARGPLCDACLLAEECLHRSK
ncbi:MAG: endonuclease III [Desulfobacterota bacterium]|nr:endonuclease III [Thermodesulfobacteriota bacterium]